MKRDVKIICILFCVSCNQLFAGTNSLILSVFVGNDTAVECNRRLDLNALVSPAGSNVSYSWKQVSGPSSYTASGADQRTYTLNFSAAGIYILSVTVKETATGAEARDEITVSVTSCNGSNPGNTNLKYIRMFSPNNDGVNDMWKLEGAGSAANLTIAIFNQQGREVFTVKNPASDLIWDGRIKGSPAPIDTYYFVVWQDGKKIIADNITLLR